MKKVSDINASSQADIAFLLLIFFLVTTSMSVDQGLFRQLPPPNENNKDEKVDQINERNILVVLINRDNQLAVEGEITDINELTDRTIKFLTNPTNSESLSEQVPASKKYQEAMDKGKTEEAAVFKTLEEQCGNPGITRGVVSLQNDRGTRYDVYIQVQNSIVAAFNICRDNFSKENWGKPFEELDADKQKLVKAVFPLSISEAEPREVK
ncbi:MAG: biopolymer transporter ExbD [Bacteroidales bacterium]|nr:biopolymer transporter ExbD [Bacteroidales bacterium]